MKELEISEKYIIYEDYSVRIRCSHCGEWNTYSKNSRQAELLNKFKEKSDDWTCDKCFKSSHVAEIDERQVQIEWGQALNLAQGELLKTMDSDNTEYWNKLSKLRQVYFDYIINNHKQQ